ELNKIFTATSATFPGGVEAWLKYLNKNLNRDLPVEKGAPPGKYRVDLSFIVDVEGNVSHIKAENNPGFGTAEEAIQVIKKGPKWIPAKRDGMNITSLTKQTITFVISEEHESYDKVFTQTKVPAEFPGGITAWRKYLERNLDVKLPVKNGAGPGKYAVQLSFIVDDKGIVSQVKAENDPGFGTAEEAIRMIKNGPMWIPAKQNGKDVTSLVKQTITFVVSK
ncbi:MAG: energy transducer TonB, partial [Bacteroidota bacterium]|nr:energy transducer TonB [Bacteroidota bacterium]